MEKQEKNQIIVMDLFVQKHVIVSVQSRNQHLYIINGNNDCHWNT